MRKIDETTRTAVNNKIDFHSQNTFVMYLGKINTSSVFLHGHKIYTRNHDNETEYFSLHGWNTQTTRARINACLKQGHIVQRKGKAIYINYGLPDYTLDNFALYQVTDNGLEKLN